MWFFFLAIIAEGDSLSPLYNCSLIFVDKIHFVVTKNDTAKRRANNELYNLAWEGFLVVKLTKFRFSNGEIGFNERESVVNNLCSKGL